MRKSRLTSRVTRLLREIILSCGVLKSRNYDYNDFTGTYCPLRGMGEKPSPLGEDFSRPAGPETRQPRSARRLGCCPINTVRDKGFFLGGGENRIHSGEL